MNRSFLLLLTFSFISYILSCKFTIRDESVLGSKTSAWISETTALPMLCFSDRFSQPQPKLKVMAAKDRFGIAWEEPLLVPANPYTRYGQYVEGISLSDGSPAILFQEYTGTMRFDDLAIRATNASGLEWNDVIVHSEVFDYVTDQTGWVWVMLSDNRPAIFSWDEDNQCTFRAATTPQMTAFGPVHSFGSNFYWGAATLLADNRVAVKYTDAVARKAWLVTSTDATATAWNAPELIMEYSYSAERFWESSMIALNNAHILIVHRGRLSSTYKIYASTSANAHGGAPWNEVVVQTSMTASTYFSLKLLNSGRPMVAFAGPGSNLYVASATTPGASVWNIPHLVDNTINGLHEYVSLIILNSGLPMIIYSEGTYSYIRAAIADDAEATDWIAQCPNPADYAPTKLPTKAPTTAPSSAPITPTASPTKAPTTSPTLSPSKAPSRMPTSSPTLSPTTSPTKTPTVPPGSPSRAPTKRPTRLPTSSPTRQPSNQPTKIPTMRPTIGGDVPMTTTSVGATPTTTMASLPPTSAPSAPSTSADPLEMSSSEEAREETDLTLIIVSAVAALLCILLVVALVCLCISRRRSRPLARVSDHSLPRASRRSTSTGRHQYGAAPRRSTTTSGGGTGTGSFSLSRRSERRSRHNSKHIYASFMNMPNVPDNASVYTLPSVNRSSFSATTDASSNYVELKKTSDESKAQVGVYAPAPSKALQASHYIPLEQKTDGNVPNEDNGYQQLPSSVYQMGELKKEMDGIE